MLAAPAGSASREPCSEQAGAIRILEVDGWQATRYPEGLAGRAGIARTVYAPGYYPMEGVAGYWFWHNRRPLPVTALRLAGEAIMVDDPLHWTGMRLFAQAASGRVLVGGLGLGLVLHHLARNHRVIAIDVVERDEDVAALVQPLLPADPRIRIETGDVLACAGSAADYDTIIIDLWVNSPSHGVRLAGGGEAAGVADAVRAFRTRAPGARVYCWGMKSRQHNPAITVDLPPLYGDLVRRKGGA